MEQLADLLTVLLGVVVELLLNWICMQLMAFRGEDIIILIVAAWCCSMVEKMPNVEL